MNLSQNLGSCRLRFLALLAKLAIHIYRLTVSPILRARGCTCLHYPSCSQYGLLAFEKYGFCVGLMFTISRWRDCHPFSGRPYIDYP